MYWHWARDRWLSGIYKTSDQLPSEREAGIAPSNSNMQDTPWPEPCGASEGWRKEDKRCPLKGGLGWKGGGAPDGQVIWMDN